MTHVVNARKTPWGARAMIGALLGLTASAALAGDPLGYGGGHSVTRTTTGSAIPAQPGVTYQSVSPYAPSAIVYAPEPRDGLYDARKYGGNEEFGYKAKSACGGLIEGEKCLVLLGDHMRRVRLERDAGTILVGNPAIADVTVLGADTMFVSARSTGSTNIIVLDKNNDEIATYEVFVREPETKRVTLRHGLTRETFQCAPHCERALSQVDSTEAHSAQSQIITTELGLDQQAIALQSGVNPNTQGEALQAQLSGAEAAAGAAAAPLAGAGTPGAGLAAMGGGGQMGAATRSLDALLQIGSVLGGAGGGAPAPALGGGGGATPLPLPSATQTPPSFGAN